MALPLPPILAPSMRQVDHLPARTRRKKYAGARAFFLVVLVISTLAAWSILKDGRKPIPAADGKTLLRRVAESPLEAHGSLKKQDLDVRPPG